MARRRPLHKASCDFEYNSEWGGPAPSLLLCPSWRPNASTAKAFDLSPYRQFPGTWSGSTTQRLVADAERGMVWPTSDANNDFLDIGDVDVVNGATQATFAGWFRENALVLHSIQSHDITFVLRIADLRLTLTRTVSCGNRGNSYKSVVLRTPSGLNGDHRSIFGITT